MTSLFLPTIQHDLFSMLRALLIHERYRQIGIFVTLQRLCQIYRFWRSLNEILADTQYRLLAVIASWLTNGQLLNVSVDEVINEVWCRGITAIWSGTNIQDPKRWIWRVSHNVVHEWKRQFWRELQRTENTETLDLENLIHDFESDNGSLHENYLRIQRTWLRLEKDDRKILRLKYVQQKSWREIAEGCLINEDTMRQRGHRALERFRKLYADYDG